MKKFLCALCLLFALGSFAWGRGGGGCFEAGTLIETPAGEVPIEQLRIGDSVCGGSGPARVEAVHQVEPAEYLEIIQSGRTLHVTPEHPFAIAAGVFQIAEQRFPNARRVSAQRPAYNLLVNPGGTFLVNGMVVHNKGCFLPDTLILRTDGSQTPISQLQIGDSLQAFTTEGAVVSTAIHRILTHEVNEYLIVTTDKMTVRVTVEHPFYVGEGIFKTFEVLAVGDQVFGYDGKGISAQRVANIERVQQPVRVYNLQTDAPNTFFANGIAVHNKGGGGCFPAGTNIRTPAGVTLIEKIRRGDAVVAITENGLAIRTRVERIFTIESPILVIDTDAGPVHTTSEHPFRLITGGFAMAGTLTNGTSLSIWESGCIKTARVLSVRIERGFAPVYNLEVGPPHTFVAENFIVHNKGGGGGGGGFGRSGYRGGRSSGSSTIPTSPEVARVLFTVAAIVVGGVIIYAILAHRRTEDEDLDFCFSRTAIEPKLAKTAKLLDFIARIDPAFTAVNLEQTTTTTFVKLQECWEARQYDEMAARLMPDLYRKHCAQIASLLRNHEINRIDSLRVQKVDIVNIRYTQKPEEREFTALITASARDYYVDDRTNDILRGDDTAATFQEFWTFQFFGGKWLLREVEQSRESDALKSENFFEPFTDKGVNHVYAETAANTGPAGPWLSAGVDTKETRIERLLNFLVQTDKLWDRSAMVERARQVFMNVLLTREAGDPAGVTDIDLFPDVAEALRKEINHRQTQGAGIQYRNLCIRKVELVWVRNSGDNKEDEFVARISAHAQRIITRHGAVVGQDNDVTPFIEFWTFGRWEKQWRLKEVLPDTKGEEFVVRENVDEESSQDKLDWYYKHTRAT